MGADVKLAEARSQSAGRHFPPPLVGEVERVGSWTISSSPGFIFVRSNYNRHEQPSAPPPRRASAAVLRLREISRQSYESSPGVIGLLCVWSPGLVGGSRSTREHEQTIKQPCLSETTRHSQSDCSPRRERNEIPEMLLSIFLVPCFLFIG